MNPLNAHKILSSLPPVWPEEVLNKINQLRGSLKRKVVVLDDDPTGTQTVSNIPVVTRWDRDTIANEFEQEYPGFFILTNSRSLNEYETRKLHHAIGTNLKEAAKGRAFTLISRSDSTLRGHFPAETDTLGETFGDYSLTVLAPYFEAGGRLTVNNIHYVADRDELIPAHLTPFAKDTAFGYSTSGLPEWVEEKTARRIRAENVNVITLDLIRRQGPDAVERRLMKFPPNSVCIVNAADRRDIEVFAQGALQAESRGKRILFRTAASFVSATLGQAPSDLLSTTDLKNQQSSYGGLIVAGSYVPKTTKQLIELRRQHHPEEFELPVSALLSDKSCQELVEQVATRINTSLTAGDNVLLFTSRQLVTGNSAADNLGIGQVISSSICSIIKKLRIRPRFIIAKGGITSSDIATSGLGVTRSIVAGQLLPGVPVWYLGNESRFPGLAYVIFPGNVGSDETLAEAVSLLSGDSF